MRQQSPWAYHGHRPNQILLFSCFQKLSVVYLQYISPPTGSLPWFIFLRAGQTTWQTSVNWRIKDLLFAAMSKTKYTQDLYNWKENFIALSFIYSFRESVKIISSSSLLRISIIMIWTCRLFEDEISWDQLQYFHSSIIAWITDFYLIPTASMTI